MIQAVVFDFDGVVVDSEPLHYQALVRVCRRVGVDIGYREYLARFLGFDDRDIFRVLLRGRLPPGRSGTDMLARLVAAKGDEFDQLLDAGIPAVPGALRLIGELKGFRPIAVATGATRRDFDRVAGRLGLAGAFDAEITADDVTRSKPDPETYRRAVQALAARFPHLDLLPAGCLAIEDSPHGIDAARAAGLRVLALSTTTGAANLGRADRILETLEPLTLADIDRWL